MRIAVKGFRGNHTNLVTLSKACLAMIEPMRQKKDGRETVTVGHLRSPGKDDRASSLNRPIRSATRHCLVARTGVDPTLPQVEHQHARLPTRSHFQYVRNKNPAWGAPDSCLRPRDSAGHAHLPDRAFSLGERRLIDAPLALAASARSAKRASAPQLRLASARRAGTISLTRSMD